MPLILDRIRQHWECPNCDEKAVTWGEPNRFHECPKLHGMSAPMVLEGTIAKVEAHEREDYIGDEKVQTDGEGRPIMSVTVEREYGQDVVVYAPMAQSDSEALAPAPPPIDYEALKAAARAEALEAVEKAIYKLEKERSFVASSEEALAIAREALAEIEAT